MTRRIYQRWMITLGALLVLFTVILLTAETAGAFRVQAGYGRGHHGRGYGGVSVRFPIHTGRSWHSGGHHVRRYDRFRGPSHHYRSYRSHHYRSYWPSRPAIGSIHLGLPLGCGSFYVGSSLYYTFGDIWYRPVPTGYMVVDAPVAAVQSAPSVKISDRAVVSVPALNVRSGPGMGHQVVGVVNQGDRLEIEEASGQWLYVRTPGGYTGWVMSQYTRRDAGNG